MVKVEVFYFLCKVLLSTQSDYLPCTVFETQTINRHFGQFTKHSSLLAAFERVTKEALGTNEWTKTDYMS